MTQLASTLPDGRLADPPRPLGAAFVSVALTKVPTVPADGDLLLAREAAALVAEEHSEFTYAAFTRRGCYDDDNEVQAALQAIRLVRGAK